MTFRDRIKGLRRIRAGDLVPNPKNWRSHPEPQRAALRGVLTEIGFADAVIARKLPSGKFEILDGHLRADLDPEQTVPVLVTDLDDAEAAKLMLTLDPLAAMAEADAGKLAALMQEIDTESEALRAMLDAMSEEAGIGLGAGVSSGEEDEPDAADQTVADSWSLVVACADEADQQTLYERLTAEGRKCRPLTL